MLSDAERNVLNTALDEISPKGSLNRFWSGVKTCSNRQIIKSTFILRYSDEVELREADRASICANCLPRVHKVGMTEGHE
jgi:hypothetical protein